MERLFSPCTRYRDISESQGHRHELLQEINLDVSTEELLSSERAFTYTDLYVMLGNDYTVAWLTSHAAVVRTDEEGALYPRFARFDYKSFNFIVDGKGMAVVYQTSVALSKIVDVVRRLLLANAREVYDLTFSSVQSPGALFNAHSLAYLLKQCQNLNVLRFWCLDSLSEDHVRVLGDFSKPDLEIYLKQCRITGAAASVLAEVLGRNQGPTKLDSCWIDNFLLAKGLRGNSRLKSLRPRIPEQLGVGNREVLAIAGALKENKGLVDLDFFYRFRMSDETWNTLCDSLKTHPTLQVLSLQQCVETHEEPPMAPAVLNSRIQALVDALRMNTSIHTIHLVHRRDTTSIEHELLRQSTIPYLERNRLRPRVSAIQKTRPITYRAKILGRALLSARTNPNSFWMLLSGNVEVALPSKVTMIAAAANVPTPTTTTAATTSSANIAAAVAASVMSAAAAALRGSHPSAVATLSTASDAFTFDPTVATVATVATAATAATVATAATAATAAACCCACCYTFY
jgi:hypothetical protein